MLKEYKKLTGYEDDWYLMEHPEFYQEAMSLGLLNPKDFSKVPGREVYALYQEYQRLPLGKARTEFRKAHSDLDTWGKLAGIWKS